MCTRRASPALMAALAKRRAGGRLLFDIRGFMPEEYTDAGVWPAGGTLYRGVKRVERFLFNSADAFVVLTEKAREILFPGRLEADERGRPVEVIPCCVDFSVPRATCAARGAAPRAGARSRRVVVSRLSRRRYMADETADSWRSHKQRGRSRSSSRRRRRVIAQRLASWAAGDSLRRPRRADRRAEVSEASDIAGSSSAPATEVSPRDEVASKSPRCPSYATQARRRGRGDRGDRVGRAARLDDEI